MILNNPVSLPIHEAASSRYHIARNNHKAYKHLVAINKNFPISQNIGFIKNTCFWVLYDIYERARCVNDIR